MNKIKDFVPELIFDGFLFCHYPLIEQAAFNNSNLFGIDNVIGLAATDCYLK